MTRKNILLKSKDRRALLSVASFLQELGKRLEEGKVTLHQGSEEIVIEVPDDVLLSVKAKEKTRKRGMKHTFAVQITWFDGDKRGGGVTLG